MADSCLAKNNRPRNSNPNSGQIINGPGSATLTLGYGTTMQPKVTVQVKVDVARMLIAILVFIFLVT